jgi:hypothetical protein
MVMGHPRQRRTGGQRGAGGGLWGGLEQQRTPVGFARFPSQACNRCLAWSLATCVATMVLGKYDQIEGRVGDGPCGALAGRSEEGIDQFDQRRSWHHGIQFRKNHRLQWCTLLLQTTFGTIQPLLALRLMVAFVFGMRLGGERRRVPRQDQGISDLLGDKSKKGDR